MHIGKRFPTTMINTTYFIENDTYWPPRKMQLVSNPLGSIGTIAALWAGTTVVSDLPYRHSSNPLHTAWDFENRSDPLATMTFQMWIEEQSPVPGGGLVYQWHYWLDTFYNGTKLADYEQATRHVTDMFPSATATNVGPTWFHRINNALWMNLYACVKSATWPQQPEYHPYRH